MKYISTSVATQGTMLQRTFARNPKIKQLSNKDNRCDKVQAYHSVNKNFLFFAM